MPLILRNITPLKLIRIKRTLLKAIMGPKNRRALGLWRTGAGMSQDSMPSSLILESVQSLSLLPLFSLFSLSSLFTNFPTHSIPKRPPSQDWDVGGPILTTNWLESQYLSVEFLRERIWLVDDLPINWLSLVQATIPNSEGELAHQGYQNLVFSNAYERDIHSTNFYWAPTVWQALYWELWINHLKKKKT